MVLITDMYADRGVINDYTRRWHIREAIGVWAGNRQQGLFDITQRNSTVQNVRAPFEMIKVELVMLFSQSLITVRVQMLNTLPPDSARMTIAYIVDGISLRVAHPKG